MGNNRSLIIAFGITSGIMLALLVVILGACGVRTAVPGFKYPVYDPDTPWPKLAPTTTLEQAANIDVAVLIEEVDRLKQLSN